MATHRSRRPADWTTVETLDLAGVIADATVPVLVDCLGRLAVATPRRGRGLGPTGRRDRADSSTRGRSCSARGPPRASDVVAVTNEVGLGVVPATASGRLFRDELGRLNAALSAASQHVHLVVAGRVLDLSGAPLVEG